METYLIFTIVVLLFVNGFLLIKILNNNRRPYRHIESNECLGSRLEDLEMKNIDLKQKVKAIAIKVKLKNKDLRKAYRIDIFND